MCEYINGAIIQEDFTMEKTIYDESNGLWYELRGDYYIPCLAVPAQEERPIGIWGRRHLQYIKKERKPLYMELMTSGRLNTYLADINEKATEQMLLLTKQNLEQVMADILAQNGYPVKKSEVTLALTDKNRVTIAAAVLTIGAAYADAREEIAALVERHFAVTPQTAVE